MSQAVICPVCKGEGKVCDGMNSTAPHTKTCYGCAGKGWVEVGYNTTPWYLYIPTYPPYPQYPLYPWNPIITYTYSSVHAIAGEE